MNMIESNFGLLSDPRTVIGTAVFLLALIILFFGRRAYRRFRYSRTPYLEIMDTGIIKPAYSSNAGYFNFRIINTHGGCAEIQEVELVLADSGASTKARQLHAGKVVDKYDFVAKLRSDQKQFKLSINGRRTPNVILSRAEAKIYRIKLVSDEYHWYRFLVRVKWRNIRDKKETRVTQSRDQYIEFTVI